MLYGYKKYKPKLYLKHQSPISNFRLPIVPVACVSLIFLAILGFSRISNFILQHPQKETPKITQEVLNIQIADEKVDVSALLPPPDNKPLTDYMQEIVEGLSGEYGIAIKNLATGQEYYYNEHKKFTAASLYKLWVMGSVYEQIQKGVFSSTDNLGSDITSLNTRHGISSESAELKEGSISTTVQDAIDDMIMISNNYSAYLLSDKVQPRKVTVFLNTYGLKESNYFSDPPYTTAYDVRRYFELLYYKKIVSAEYSDLMLSILQLQQRNDRIPKYLTEAIVVAHKTGELYGVKHDAGIVYAPKGDYIVVLMSDTKDPSHAAEEEALISKKIFDFFQGNTTPTPADIP